MTSTPKVELNIGGTWTDITTYVRYTQGIKITRGQPDENQKTNPSTASFRLANLDGRFSPRNPLGPYYGQIDRNTPCRISVQNGASPSYRFWGEVSSWPADWDPTGNDAWVDIQASGPLRRLGQGSTPLHSTLYLGLTSSIAQQVVAYWPCEDGASATRIAAAIGNNPMSIQGAPTLASNSNFACSAPLPVMNTGSFTGRVPRYTQTSQTQVRFLMQLPAGATNGQRICRIITNGSAQVFELVYSTGGVLTLTAYDTNGTQLATTGPVGFGVDDELLRVSVELTQVGSNITANIATVVPNAPNGLVAGMTVTGATVGRVTTVILAPDKGLASMVVGHLSVQSIVTALGDLGSQLNAWNGEAADARIGRLLGDAGIAYEGVGGNSVAMGPQHVDTLLNLVQECVDADGGVLFESTDQLGLGYRTRDGLLNQAPVLVLDYAQSHLSDVPKPVDDDTYTRNDVTVTRLNGSSTRATQPVGPLNVQSPPAGVGQYQTSVTLNCQTDAQTVDLAGWRLHLGTAPEPRYPTIGVQLARSEITSALRSQILGVAPGGRMEVVNPPAWLPPDPISELVIGWTETIDQFLHAVQWNTRPESPFRVAITDDPVFGHADTDGSTLAAAVTAAATSLSLATTNAGSPTWTTKLADYPFDLSVGGERVTAVSPGTNLTTDPLMAAGLTHWTGSNSAAAPDATHQYVTGQTPIMITPVAGQVSGGVNAAAKTGVGTVTPAATYTLGCWVYSPQGWTDCRVCFDAYDASGVFLSSVLGNPTTVPAGVWTFLTQDLTAPASTSQALPRFRWGSTPGSGVTFWVWDITMVPDSTVTAVSPQPVTVIRSVNGVIKAQLVNTAVQLYQPAIVTM